MQLTLKVSLKYVKFDYTSNLRIKKIQKVQIVNVFWKKKSYSLLIYYYNFKN